MGVQEISPRGLELRDEINRLMVSITSIDRRIAGISYCEAYPKDWPRCENITVDNIPVSIDWELDDTAGALFAVRDEFGLSLTLHQVSTETKVIFRQILSTFWFLE